MSDTLRYIPLNDTMKGMVAQLRASGDGFELEGIHDTSVGTTDLTLVMGREAVARFVFDHKDLSVQEPSQSSAEHCYQLGLRAVALLDLPSLPEDCTAEDAASQPQLELVGV